MSELFETKPRWRGAPPICIAENRLAFKDRAELDAFRASIGMSSYALLEVWRCETCGHLHHIGKIPTPSGESSGTSRSQERPKLAGPLAAAALERLRGAAQ